MQPAACVSTCLPVDIMYVFVRVLLQCVAAVSSPGGCSPAADACSGDSIVSMSKDLPAALFHHVFIMLIRRKGRNEGGGKKGGEGLREGRGNDSKTNREKR